MPDTKKLSEDEAEVLSAVIRDLIKHENELVNQRIGWLAQLQGLLFAALAFAWDKAPLPLTLLLSLVGILTAVSVRTALVHYSPTVQDLNTWWKKHRPDSMADAPYVIGSDNPHKPGSFTWRLRPWRALPFIFGGAWLGVAVLATAVHISCPSGIGAWDAELWSYPNIAKRP